MEHALVHTTRIMLSKKHKSMTSKHVLTERMVALSHQYLELMLARSITSV